MTRGQGKEKPGSDVSSKQSPKRSRPAAAVLESVREDADAPDCGMEDHELELESLIQLNFEAASGELPTHQVLETDQRASTSKPISEISTPQNLPFTNAVASLPVAQSFAVPELIRKPRRLPQKASGKPSSTNPTDHGFLPFTDEDEVNPGEAPVLRYRVEQYDDRDAVNALIRGLQPFTSNADNLHSGVAYPLALPVPIVGVAENSSLKEFRDQMIERHQECEVPLPDNDDLARLLLELKDDQSLHLQLPALAFPITQRESRSEGQFVLVGNCVLDQKSGRTELVAVNGGRRLRFEISQQNIPSLATELFVFHHAKNETDSGIVRLQTVDLAASLSGSLNFPESSHDEVGLSQRRDAILNKTAAENKILLERTAERKRKFEAPPIDTAAAKSSDNVILYPPSPALKRVPNKRKGNSVGPGNVPEERVVVARRREW